ncbi:MAG TPA: hypothetical protein VGK73_31270 [Polyangiaceae bacterium]
MCLGVAASAPHALAETDQERAGARSAATAGADAFDAGKYPDALAMFQRAESLVHSPVHLSYIAQCQVKLGQLVEARETYLKLKRETVPPGAHPAVKRAIEEAPGKLASLEPRVPSLAIKLEGVNAGESVDVTLDGAKIAPALVGIPAPANPGEHVVRAAGPGKDSGDVRVTLSEGQHEEVLIRLNATAAAAPAAVTPATTPSPTTAEPTADQGTSGSSLTVPAYISLGVGVVGLGLGTFFIIGAGKSADDADALCGGSREECTIPPGPGRDEAEEKMDEATSKQTLAIVGFAVGGVGIAAGVTMLVLGMNKSKKADATYVVPYASWDRVGVTGRF